MGEGPPSRTVFEKCRNASIRAFILPPQVHAVEPRPPESPELPEVVELQDSAFTENFQALFRVRPVSVGEVMNAPDRTIRIGDTYAHGLFVDGCVTQIDNWCAGQKSQKIQEMAGFADDTPSAPFWIEDPVVSGHCSGIHGVDECLWPLRTGE